MSPNDKGSMKQSNSLQGETSPYLLQHKDNPVHWYPWGEEALTLARRLNRPIFLSVGYSTCHWCHVMERESFKNDTIASIMNESFVSVKVDREERPDIDAQYMLFVQATTGIGGWPMSVFLTPHLKPFFGGTYFPPIDQPLQPGFATILRVIAQKWQSDDAAIYSKGENISKLLQETIESVNCALSTNDCDPKASCSAIYKSFVRLSSTFDHTHGGFGEAPKFPSPVNFAFLFALDALAIEVSMALHSSTRNRHNVLAQNPAQLDALMLALGITNAQTEGDCLNTIEAAERTGSECRRMALKSLEAIYRGAIHDHVGGGYHRYATDSKWRVPHFEKMLYDQAQMIEAFSTAYLVDTVDRQAQWASAIRDVFQYVRSNLTSDAGAFYCGQDADSLPHREDGPGHGGLEKSSDEPAKVEGAFALWNLDQLSDAIKDPLDYAVFVRHFGIERCPLSTRGQPTEAVTESPTSHSIILYEMESIDETAEYCGVKSTEECARIIAKCLDLLRSIRCQRPPPQLDDKVVTSWNGLMISALCSAGIVTGDHQYLQAAKEAMHFIMQVMYSKDRGGLGLMRCHCKGQTSIPAFAIDYASTIDALLSLWQATLDDSYRDLAIHLQDEMDGLFWDDRKGHGGYFTCSNRRQRVFLSIKDCMRHLPHTKHPLGEKVPNVRKQKTNRFASNIDQDGAEPSANSMAASNMARLYCAVKDEKYRERLLDLLGSFHDHLLDSPKLLSALIFHLALPRQISLLFNSDASRLRAIKAKADLDAIYSPFKMYTFENGRESEGPSTRSHILQVCRGNVCLSSRIDGEDIAQSLSV